MANFYRVTLFDKNNVKPNRELIIEATSKAAAKAAAKEQIFADGRGTIDLITDGTTVCRHTVNYAGTEKGADGKTHKVIRTSKATVRSLSSAYYNYLIGQNWGIAACEQVVGCNSGVSSESAVNKAAAALETAQRECESVSASESPMRKRKLRWTRAQKRAAAEARKAATDAGMSPADVRKAATEAAAKAA